MARTGHTDSILDIASEWRDRCLLADGSMFSDRALWTRAVLAEVSEHFIDRPDLGNRTFLAKLHDQLAPASAEAKQLTAELLWLLLLFPSNITPRTKVEQITHVWGWSGEVLSPTHPALLAMADGIGSGGQGFNNYRPLELHLAIRAFQDWKVLSAEEQQALIIDPWSFGAWLDRIDGAERRQFRHMLLHLLFPDSYERMSSPRHKELVEEVFAAASGAVLTPDDLAMTPLGRDRRLLRTREALEAATPGVRLDFYEGSLRPQWFPEPDATKKPDPAPPPVTPPPDDAPPGTFVGVPPFAQILTQLQDIGLRLSPRTLRRYHLALDGRGFVILSGISGTGKTWLAEAYGAAIGAQVLVVPVAPNWRANEDLLGYSDPLTGAYRDTSFSLFLRAAATEYAASRKAGRVARPFHLVLDEMNLARVENYFATFLSGMELRMRCGEARIALGASESVPLTPNLTFVGTVNVDETTHGFAEKVFDRAQVIELIVARDDIEAFLGPAPYRAEMLALWDALHLVAPFAYRVLDETTRYVASATSLVVPWEELFDEIILQKILPKLRGTDPRVGDALAAVAELSQERFPLTHAKVRAMSDTFQQHGVVSFF